MPDSARNELGHFVPGTSGNPSGRPAGIKTFSAYAREKTLQGKALIDFWDNMMNGRIAGARASDKNRAAECLAERAYGKAMDLIATMDVSSDDAATESVRQMALDALTALAALPARNAIIEGSTVDPPRALEQNLPSSPELSEPSEG